MRIDSESYRRPCDQTRPMLTRKAAKAFTIIELLVCIAIIGVLVSLIMPAIMSAREGARRASCMNHLRQMGLAVANYESVFREFPAGCIGCMSSPPGQPFVRQRFLSWNVQLLPFLERRPLFGQFNLNLPSYQSPNKEAGAKIVDVFICPSVPDPKTQNNVGLWKGMAFTDYGGIYGVEGVGHDSTPGSQHYINDRSLGVLIYEEAVSSRSVRDGLSNTALISEFILRRKTEDEWANGQNLFAQEANTPINSRSGLGNDIGSAHPQGAGLVFCDGHFEFLSQTMDQVTLNALLTKDGQEVVSDRSP